MSKFAILLPVEQNGTFYLQDKLSRLYNCTRTDTDAQVYLRTNGNRNNAIRVSEDNGQLKYRACNKDLWTASSSSYDDFDLLASSLVNVKAEEVMSDERKNIIAFVNSSISLKPNRLKMQPIKWKYLMRSVVREKNIMLVGSSGAGKTFAIQSVQKAFPDRPFFDIPLGSTQDARSAIIGNTHFSKEEGTYFSESYFVKAIQTENAIIHMDELSRAHPDCWNILMSVLDPSQRYLRLDEADGSPTIKVAKGVCFLATANIGNEYTSTRVLDRALIDRFTIIEFDLLTGEEEKSLLKEIYPELSDIKIAAIADIADATRKEIKTETSKIGTIISTRATIEIAGLMNDGFKLEEAADVAIFPFYPEEGGADSERVYMKQLVQRFLSVDETEDLFGLGDEETAVPVDASNLSRVKPF